MSERRSMTVKKEAENWARGKLEGILLTETDNSELMPSGLQPVIKQERFAGELPTPTAVMFNDSLAQCLKALGNLSLCEKFQNE